MRVLKNIRRSVAVGALGGGLYFTSDLVGATMAVGWLFDATVDSVLLVLVAAVMTVAAGAVVGGGGGMLLRALLRGKRVFRRPSTRVLGMVTALTWVAVAIGGYALRRGRNIEALPDRPSVTALRPLPVLWVVVDTLRADTLYGDDFSFPLTPRVRDFARDALVFSDAESAAGWTIPSMATLMTGIHPVTLYSARHFLPDWAPTLATRLRAAGYETRAVVDNALLEPRNGFAQGFESYFQRSGLRFAFSLPGLRMLPTVVREYLREHLHTFYFGAPGVTREAGRIIAAQRHAPLFMYVHYMDPHFPYYPHPDLASDPHDSEPVNLALAMARVREEPEEKPSPAQMRFLEHRYKNEVRALDDHLAALLADWTARYGEQSLVVITADHGEEFLDHGELGHGNSLYAELVNVPLLIKFPPSTVSDEHRRGITDATVGHVDLVPTVLDLLGVGAEVGAQGIRMQGQSWMPWLLGDAPEPQRPLFATQHRHMRRIYRWREGRYVHITRYYRGQAKQWLFDAHADPTEQNDLIGTHGATSQAMYTRFQPFMRRQEAERDPKPVTVRADPESLRALGYIQ